ncbi:MAG: hypothetical protein RLZZ401_115, partial [Pseudomonadota bacterium]
MAQVMMTFRTTSSSRFKFVARLGNDPVFD